MLRCRSLRALRELCGSISELLIAQDETEFSVRSVDSCFSRAPVFSPPAGTEYAVRAGSAESSARCIAIRADSRHVHDSSASSKSAP